VPLTLVSWVGEVFRLLKRRHPTWLVLANARFMLQLDRGSAMRYLIEELDAMKYRCAYRGVDSRFTGVPQRRQRVILVGSRTEDPRTVLFADDAGPRPRPDESYADTSYGFYSTEGVRGLGGAVDALPTLKDSSTIGTSSPPAVWLPSRPAGAAIGLPSIGVGEQLQGFPSDWTEAADSIPKTRKGVRWKLVGNAVTTGVSQ
jgi:DNA (cytosine-5)-methyltransferase 1